MEKLKRWVVCLLCLSALVAHAQQPPPPIQFHIERFVIAGEMPLDASPLLAALANQDYDLNGLQGVAQQLEQLIRSEGYAFYRVLVPPQTISNHEVTLQVIEFRLNNTEFHGLNHFDQASVQRTLPGLVMGESPNTDKLARQLKVANRHPSKDLRLTFKQSRQPSLIDALVSVEEQDPQQFSLILTNTGSEQSGDYRLTAMYQNANLWEQDHIINLSATTTPSLPRISDVRQYAMSYSLPFYAQSGWLSGYAVYSDVNSGQVDVAGGISFDIAGAGELAGIHWLQHLPRSGRYEHWLDVGIDTRFFDNAVRSGGVDQVDDIRSTPVSLQYQGEYAWSRSRINFSLQQALNTGWFGYNNQADYDGSGARPAAGTDVDWRVTRFGMLFDHAFDRGWAFRTALDGQWSGEPLISGEQFGIGGSSSVRGYQERETNADSGISLRSELFTPAWHQVTGVVFVDYGRGQLEKPQPGFDTREWELISWGVGLRARWRRLDLSIDLAQAEKSAPATLPDPTQTGDHRLHGVLAWQF